MRTDVPALIAALTTERNSLDRAIAALRLITAEPSAPRAAKIASPRTYISNAAKTAIVAQMRLAEHKGNMAKSLGKQYGVPSKTIRGAFHRWARTLDNANGNTATAGA